MRFHSFEKCIRTRLYLSSFYLISPYDSISISLRIMRFIDCNVFYYKYLDMKCEKNNNITPKYIVFIINWLLTHSVVYISL